MAPFSYANRWSVAHCRSCYAWMPDMDLKLPSAIPYRRDPEAWRHFGETRRQIEAFERARAA